MQGCCHLTVRQEASLTCLPVIHTYTHAHIHTHTHTYTHVLVHAGMLPRYGEAGGLPYMLADASLLDIEAISRNRIKVSLQYFVS